jgi:hypothetical protein
MSEEFEWPCTLNEETCQYSFICATAGQVDPMSGVEGGIPRQCKDLGGQKTK